MTTAVAYPLSPMQQGMLFHAVMEKGTGVDIEQIVLRLSADVDVSLLIDSWQVLISRHDILRTSLCWEGLAAPEQRVVAHAEIPISREDVSQFPDRQDAITALLLKDRRTDFDLTQAPLMRLVLVRVDTEDLRLVWTFHHALVDGRSFPILLRELWKIYESLARDEKPAMREPPSYRRYIEWMEAQDHRESRRFWKSFLAGFHAPTPLVVDSRCVLAPELSRQGVQELRLSGAITDGLRARAKSVGGSLNTVLQVAWAVLLHRYSGELDIVFGTTRACRKSSVSEAESMVGLLINTVPMRARIPEDGGVDALLQSLRNASIAQRPHEHTPLVQIQSCSEVPRGTPLFETAVVFDDASLDARMQGVSHLAASYEYAGQTSFPLTVIAYGDSEMLIRLEYLKSRIPETAARRMHGHLVTILHGLAEPARTQVSQLTLLSAAERHMALYGWNPHLDFAVSDTLVGIFAQQVAKSPNAVAVSFDGLTLTYAELNRRANRLAHWLIAKGVTRNQLVALRVERSELVVIGILGILKSGAAYLPLDPVYPRDRIGFMLGDAKVSLVVTEDAHIEDFRDQSVTTVRFTDTAGERDDDPFAKTLAEDLAYVIYTSGSTGKPKGVKVTHRNVARLMSATQPWYRFGAQDVWTLFHSYSFDWTVFEMWGALLFGGRLVVVPAMVAKLPDEFRELVEREQVTVLCQTPSAFKSFIQADRETADARYSLRFVIFGGEALELQSLAPWFERYGDSKPSLVNMYGITETTVHVTYRPITRADVEARKGSVVGVPIPDLQVYILDRYGDPAPVGITGEIHVGGAGVAQGYLNRPELNAQRFVTDRFRPDRQQLMYRSGDLARRLEDGDIECLGRGDDQVKIRGFRIELGEIESLIAAHPAVRTVCVMAREDVPGDKRLAAYVVSHATGDEALASQIKSSLRDKLPQYMVPADFIFLDKLPLTSNGKVDRRALPPPNTKGTQARRKLVEPGSAIEEQLARIWREVLRITQISTHDNFFSLGGDSILIIQIVSRCRDAGLKVTPRMIFDHPSIVELAAHTRALEDNELGVPLKRSRPSGGVPLSPIQQWFFQQQLADQNHWNQAYLFLVQEALDAPRMQSALDALVQHHDALRLRFKGSGATVQQTFDEVAVAELEVINLAAVDDAALGETIRAYCTRAQAALRIETGPLIAAVLFDCGIKRPARLLLAVHHLAIDGVSWRPLLEDLERAYAEGPAGLAAVRKTGSIQEWVEELQRFAASPGAAQAADYWRAIPSEPTRNSGVEGGSVELRLELDEATTQQLVVDIPSVFNTQINDVLLAGLLRAECRSTGAVNLRIDLEGHGREEVVAALDVSRTVGWFTALFPLCLSLTAEEGLDATLLNVKESLRAVPHRGVSYGALRAFSPDPMVRAELQSQGPAEILFNYLGQADALVSGMQFVSFATEPTGPWHSPAGHRTHPIEILMRTEGGKLTAVISFDPKVTSGPRVVNLLAEFKQELTALAHLVTSGGHGRRSPSDFPLATLTQVQVDAIWQRYPDLQDVYDLSPMQRLFHSLEHSGVSPGLEQWCFNITGHLDEHRLRQAVRQVTERHPILRTAFLATLGSAPVQVVLPVAHVDWEAIDLRQCDEATQRNRIDCLIEENRTRPLDLSRQAPFRFDLLRTGDAKYVLLWTTHHLCVDGWSWPLIFTDIRDAYAASARSESEVRASACRYVDYIRWLRNMRPESAAFWREYMVGFSKPTPLRRQPRPVAGVYDVATSSSVEVTLDSNEAGLLRECAKHYGVTLSTCVQLAWAIVLGHYSGRQEVVFGAAFSGRPPDLTGVEGLVGPCVTNLPMRVRLPSHADLDTLLRALQRDVSNLTAHQYLSTEEIQQCTDIPWKHRMFDSLIVFQNYQFDRDALQFGGAVQCRVDEAPEATGYAVTLAVTPAETIRIRLLSAVGAPDTQTIRELADALVGVLRGISQHADLAHLQAELPAHLAERADLTATESAQFSPSRAVETRTPTQTVVAAVWESLFGQEDIPVDINFFDLGGHSILLLRVHLRLSQELKRDIPIVMLLQYPTIRTLAQALDGAGTSGRAVSDIASRAQRQREALKQRGKSRG